ncbi:MAG TPA: fumarylacetoacetate hydrolase family protein [Chloroflexota bacterium]|nr:fumarylacetoacetate hydrolase family protein [Chloroflexota bacterium]
MRLVVYDDYRVGVLADDGVRDVTAVVPGWDPTPPQVFMNRLIAAWERLRPAIEEAAARATPRPLASVRLRPPLPAPLHIYAAPSNYYAHIAEMRGAPAADATTARELGFFLKAPGSICGPSDAIELPDRPGRRFDHESELAFIIGKEARGVARAQAMDYVWGYTCLLDITMRAGGGRNEERSLRKSFATFTPIGPALVTADEVGDYRALRVRCWVNGELRQDASPSDLIVDIPELIEIASATLPLQPGDLFATGSPPGVGPIRPGDEVVMEIDRIGRLALPVRARGW